MYANTGICTIPVGGFTFLLLQTQQTLMSHPPGNETLVYESSDSKFAILNTVY